MKPMLAKEYNGQELNFPIWAQPKLDGVRAIWNGKQLLSRSGKQILGVPHIVKYLNTYCPNLYWDGELYNPKLDFETLVGLVKRTKNIDEASALQVQYHIFDIPIDCVPFNQRCAAIKDYWNTILPPFIKIVSTRKLSKMPKDDNLNLYGDKYEGTMLRCQSNLYVGKRSSTLLKVKNFKDAEFLIIDTRPLLTFEKIKLTKREPGAKQYADGSWYRNGPPIEVPDMLGSLVCTTKQGIHFEVGSGFTDEQRALYGKNNPTGKMATIKYQELTKHKVPRFPTFKCIRDYD